MPDLPSPADHALAYAAQDEGRVRQTKHSREAPHHKRNCNLNRRVLPKEFTKKLFVYGYTSCLLDTLWINDNSSK